MIISLFIRLQLRDDVQAYQPSRNTDYAWKDLTVCVYLRLIINLDDIPQQVTESK